MMNIFKMIDKKMGLEDQYTLNFEAYDVKGNTIESGILVNEDIKTIEEIMNNNTRISTIDFTIKYAHNSLCAGYGVVVDYFIKSTINGMIQNSKHFNMTRKYKKQLQKLIIGY